MRVTTGLTAAFLSSILLSSINHILARANHTLLKPANRSQNLHEIFVALHAAAEEAQTIFGYWCGSTAAGYCGSGDFSDINTDVVTHVPFAFASISSDGVVGLDYDGDGIDTKQLLNKGVIPGISLGGSGTNANNCLKNIDTCVTTLGQTLTAYEQANSPFFFVDSDFESPEDETQMQNLITFLITFNNQYPEYQITMAPECAYLWCGEAGWPYNAYVPVINELGPSGADILYRINVQAYNNWCSLTASAGEQQFNEDVASTFIQPCQATGYLGLESDPKIFGLGVLGADADGDGYNPPDVLSSSLAAINETYGTKNAMFWDTLTDYNNEDYGKWATSNAMSDGKQSNDCDSSRNSNMATTMMYAGIAGAACAVGVVGYCCFFRKKAEAGGSVSTPEQQCHDAQQSLLREGINR